MNYEFPIINNITDVLPHIEGRTEFIVAQRDGYQVINYNVVYETTFEWDDTDPLGSAMRRECRGLIFDLDGNLLSRPFHKFFNLNEREETQYKNIDFDNFNIEAHTKEDGSMIRGIILKGKLRLCTKMGITEYSENAEAWLEKQSDDYKLTLKQMVMDDVSPIFEWVSPSNRIVLKYREDKLVLLAVRDNKNGEYFDLSDNHWRALCKVFEVAETCHLVTMGKWNNNTFMGWINNTRSQRDMEGFVLVFNNGHRVKIKTDWYVELHKLKENFQHERNVVRIIMDNTFDDKLATLKGDDDELHDKLYKFINEFSYLYKRKLEDIFNEIDEYISDSALEFAEESKEKGDNGEMYKKLKKDFATKVMPTMEDKQLPKFVFLRIDGKCLHTAFKDLVEKNLKTLDTWHDFKTWMNMTDLEWVL